MKKINVQNYMVQKGDKHLPYETKESMLDILMNPQLKLRGRDLIERHKIGQKIIAAEDAVLLEEAEYLQLKTACEALEGYCRDDVELVERIINAETVDVQALQ